MKYKVFAHYVSIEEKVIESYGILVFSGERQVAEYYDVSLERARVESLVDDLNRYEVEPVHIRDILEDFYCDNC